MTELKPLPKWILIVTGLFALLELGVSVALCLSPQAVLDTVDLNAKGVNYVIYMWAARQFAFGFILAWATFKRSVPMLTLAYIFFLVIMIGDFVIGLVQKENAIMISSLVMMVICGALIAALNKRK